MSQPAYHPLEEVLRHIDRASPEPWFPRLFLRESGADPNQLSAVLDYLALEKLIAKVPGRSLETGQGVVLTDLGKEVVRDPALMDRLRRGEALRQGDVGSLIRQGIRTPVKPYATYAIIAVNVLVYLYASSSGKRFFDEFTMKYAAQAGKVHQGQWWLLMTSVFMHGSLLHIGSNMFSLWSVGSFVEQAWGRWRYLIIYLLAGWGGSCLAMAMQPGIPVVGASGAICGVLGAVGVWFLLYGRHIRPEAARSGLWQVAISVGLIAALGLMVPHISNWGHLGGGIAGALAALALHVQRFGVGRIKAPAMRWGVGVLMLLAIPVGSDVQMQRTWVPRQGGAGREEIDITPPKDLPTKPQDAGESGSFYRNYGKELAEASELLYVLYDRMPRSGADIKDDGERVQKAGQFLRTYREAFAKNEEELKAKRYTDAYVEQARKEALAVTRTAITLIEDAIGHLKDPTKAGEENLRQQFNRFVRASNTFEKRLKPME